MKFAPFIGSLAVGLLVLNSVMGCTRSQSTSEVGGSGTIISDTSASIPGTTQLYRELKSNPIDFKSKYAGKTLELSGFISKIFLKDTGDVAVHFSDGIKESAVVATFFNANDLRGFKVGDEIKFTGSIWEELTDNDEIQLKDCSLLPTSESSGSGSIISDNSAPIPETTQLYREFKSNPIDFKSEYVGKTLELSGFISKIFPKDTGGVAVHFSDGIKERAVVADFSNANDLRGFKVGDEIKFTGSIWEEVTYTGNPYQTEYDEIWLKNCSVLR